MSDRRFYSTRWRYVPAITLYHYVGCYDLLSITEQFALSAPDGAVINLTGELTFAFEVTYALSPCEPSNSIDRTYYLNSFLQGVGRTAYGHLRERYFM